MASQRDRAPERVGCRAMMCMPFLILLILTPASSSGQGQLNLTLQFSHLSDETVVAQKNQPLLLTCSASSFLDPVRISWRFESEDIPTSDPRRVQRADGSLFIKKFLLHRKSKKPNATDPDSVANRRSDEGRYFCVIRNSVGALISHAIHVIGARLPPVPKVQQMPPVEAELESNVRLSCQTNATSATVGYEWFSSNQLLNSSARYNRLPNGILQVVNVSQADAGAVTCSIVFNSNVFPAKEWRISVLPRDEKRSLLNHEIASPALKLTRRTKEPAALECLTREAADTALVNWTRAASRPLPASASVDPFGNLHLVDLTPEDSGSYVCSLNANGSESNVTHSLRVIEKPFISRPPQNLANPSSQTARFDCTAEGTPLPTVQWFKDAKPVSLTGRLSAKADDQRLVISQTVASDSGIYQCLVENEAGSATAAARLVISASNDQPAPPRVLRLVSLSPTSVRLEFEPADGSHIKAYTIHYTPAGGQELQYVSPNTSVVVHNLLPFTNYSFYVRAYDKSASEPSPLFYVQTAADVPVKSPKIALTALSSTTLRISWQKLPPELARGQVTKHEIHYRKRTQTPYLVAEVPDGQVEFFDLENLQPGTKYDVRVLAATSAGFPRVSEGPLWPWTSAEMPPIDWHILTTNYTDPEIESSSTPVSTASLTTLVPEKQDNLVNVPVARLLVWIMAGSAISAALVCLCILTLHCRKKSSSTPCGDESGNCAFANGNLPSMYGDLGEGREMESFLEANAAANKLPERGSDAKTGYVSMEA